MTRDFESSLSFGLKKIHFIEETVWRSWTLGVTICFLRVLYRVTLSEKGIVGTRLGTRRETFL